MIKYSFVNTNEALTGCVYVPACQLFTLENAAGFVTDANAVEGSKLAIPELGSGFVKSTEYCPSYAIAENEKGAYVDCAEAVQIPLVFKADVPAEGNYKVTLELEAQADEETVLVYLSRRRLAYHGSLKAGEKLTVSGLINVTPIIPRFHTEADLSLSLDIAIVGKKVALKSLEAEAWEGPTIYIAGDSTVTDQTGVYPYYPANSYCGWGQMLSYFTGLGYAVSNHAHSGLTTESFRSEGHHDILLPRLKKGDYCLFQFAHNDQKLMHLKAKEGYRERLIQYIEEVRSKEATPVIVTPLARNTWTWNGEAQVYNDLLKEYAQECIRIGQEYQVPVLDLHADAMALVCEMGCESAKRYFFPSDYTHSNDYGAFLFARYVYEHLTSQKVISCGETYQDWPIPEHPEMPPAREKVEETAAAVKLFEGLERPDEVLTRTEAFEMIIKTMRFFPTNVYNDMFEDVIGHEVYAGVIECAWQNGIIPASMEKDHKIEPLAPITGEELAESIRNGYRARRPQDESGLPSMEELKQKTTVLRKEAADLLEQVRI